MSLSNLKKISEAAKAKVVDSIRSKIENELRVALREQMKLTGDELEKMVAMQMQDAAVKERISRDASIGAIARMEGQVNIIGQSILIEMWDLKRQHFFEDEVGSWANVVSEAIQSFEPEKHSDVQYIKAMAYVASMILPFIAEKEVSKNPIKHNGKIVSVDNDGDEYFNIIAEPGLVGKLKDSSHIFKSIKDDEGKTKYVENMCTLSRAGLKEYARELRGENDPENIAKEIIMLVDDDGTSEKVTVTLDCELEMDREEYKIFMRQVGRLFTVQKTNDDE